LEKKVPKKVIFSLMARPFTLREELFLAASLQEGTKKVNMTATFWPRIRQKSFFADTDK
jgi:hypothetical protein